MPRIDRGVRIGADDRDRILEPLAPQHLCGGEPCRTAANNDHGRGRRIYRGPGRPLLQLVPHVDVVALPFNPSAGDRVERRRAKRFASLETETRVVERTPNGAADYEAVRQHDILAADFARDDRAVREATGFDTGGQMAILD